MGHKLLGLTVSNWVTFDRNPLAGGLSGSNWVSILRLSRSQVRVLPGAPTPRSAHMSIFSPRTRGTRWSTYGPHSNHPPTAQEAAMSDPEETMRHAADALRAEISGVLGEASTCEHGTEAGTYCWPCAQRDRGIELRAYASPAPSAAPQVYFPGDTVPAGVSLVTKHGDLLVARATPYRITGGPAAAYIEVPLPSLAEWSAIVARARDARVDQLRAAMVEADRNYQPPPEPQPGADRWAAARNTCPHGIVRGLITCPQCEPEKQAAAEAHTRAIVDGARAEREES